MNNTNDNNNDKNNEVFEVKLEQGAYPVLGDIFEIEYKDKNVIPYVASLFSSIKETGEKVALTIYTTKEEELKYSIPFHFSLVADVIDVCPTEESCTILVKPLYACILSSSPLDQNGKKHIEQKIEVKREEELDVYCFDAIKERINRILPFSDQKQTAELSFALENKKSIVDIVEFLAVLYLKRGTEDYFKFISTDKFADKYNIVISILNDMLSEKKKKLEKGKDNSNQNRAEDIRKILRNSIDEDNDDDRDNDSEDNSDYDEDKNEEEDPFYDELADFILNVNDRKKIRKEEVKDKENKPKKGYYEEYVRLHGKSTETSKYIKFLNNLDTNEDAKEEIAREIFHLSHERQNSAEYTTCVNWLENVMALPFNAPDSADFSIDIAKEIIEKSHYGMKDVKERIIEFLALRKKNNSNEGAIICLVGPPGCGKTSIGKSIATALNKNFTRFSLGSLHDEADIVGHRRTYVASEPGKIMHSIRTAKSKDPVVLLDEIDKVASKANNPLSALLEVLDPEQNKNFQDVYFDFPFDLSKVVFIITANDLSSIPLPVLDRMEVIEVHGYTENEKMHIAKEFLIPKLMKKANLTEDEFKIDDEAISDIISHYTLEAGVRNLERNISKIIRKFVLRELADDANLSHTITKEDIPSYLGVQKITRVNEVKADKVGSSLGLSVSSIGGGDVLRVEVVATNGNGTLMQTGHLGEVIKESTEVAFTLLKSKVKDDKKAEEFFSKNNFHIHLPDGAVSKDGPSAGSAIFSAFYSLYTNAVIRQHLAMTGEVNLLGEVTEIGGVKEKLLGAKLNGVTDVIIPLANKKDLEDIDEEILDGLNVYPVSNVDEVIEIAFNNKKSKKTDEKPELR